MAGHPLQSFLTAKSFFLNHKASIADVQLIGSPRVAGPGVVAFSHWRMDTDQHSMNPVFDGAHWRDSLESMEKR